MASTGSDVADAGQPGTSARFAAAREAVTAAAAVRWRLRVGLLVQHDAGPVVSRYLIGKDVVFQAVHHVHPNVAPLLAAWIGGLRAAFTALAADLLEPVGEPPRDHPLGGFPLADTRAAFDDECAVALVRTMDGDALAVLERLQPYHLDRAGLAVGWFARLAAFHHRGERATLGVHLGDVHVHPVSRVRRAGATVDVVAPPDAPLGHQERLVLARVRFPTADAAAAHQELDLDVTADVDVLGPFRGAAAGIPLLERMAMVEDYVYLAAARLDRATAAP